MGEGSTPLVRSRFIEKEIGCGELYFKLEGCNPTGSFKDRGMVLAVAKAIEEGAQRLICASTGNTSASAAAYGARFGLPTTVIIPSGRIAKGKLVQALAYGARIIAVKGNFDDSLKMIVAGVGTGGTITGIGKRLKEERKNIKIIGVDPHGSILGGGSDTYPYHVEGIGYDFFPDVLDNNIIDEYIKLPDKESFQMARRLIKEEGLLIGGSSGGAVWAALQKVNTLNKGEKCLVILPDSVRNYLTKFVNDAWMKKHGFDD